nr:unnamed protein product [Trichobilharzia regenti]
MSSKPNYERQMIVDVYDTLYTRPIKTRITGLIPSSCERLIQGLLMDSPVFLARRLLTALSKLETETVSKILLTLWNSEIEVVEKVFNEIAMESGRNKTLEEHIKTYYNRNLSEALLCLTDGKRDENEVIGEIWEGIIKWLPKTNDKIAHLDVVEMKNIFELRDVGSAGKVTQIICRRTPFQLQEDNALFTKVSWINKQRSFAIND